jgi:hypothetical protein
MSRIRPITARTSPLSQKSSQHFAPLPICVKIFHSHCYLVAKVIHVKFLCSQICVYVDTFFKYRESSREKTIKNLEHQWMPRAKEIFPRAILGTYTINSSVLLQLRHVGDIQRYSETRQYRIKATFIKKLLLNSVFTYGL